MRICFITSQFAKSYKECDKPGKFDRIKEFDYYLFTNISPYPDKNTSWDVVNVDHIFNDTKIDSNIIKSRYPKFMGWKLIKDVLKKKYDVIFYCDSTWEPQKNNSDLWIKYGTQIIEHPSGLLIRKHPRDSYKECKVIVDVKKDNAERMQKVQTFLEEHNFPNGLLMTANTIFGYNPNNIDLTAAFSDFWNEYSTYNTSHRDQPLWSYFMWKHNIKPLLFSWPWLAVSFKLTGRRGWRHKWR